MIEYHQYIHLPDEYILKKLSGFWEEDMPDGDVTSISTISKEAHIHAKIQVVEKLVFSGQIIIPHCFGKSCNVEIEPEDGDSLSEGHIIGKISGPAQIILSKERVMPNLYHLR